jgi:hypothetical protein
MPESAGMQTELESPVAGRASSVGERVTVNLTPRASQALSDVTTRTRDTKTDVINRALLIYAYVEQVLGDGGAVYVQADSDSPLQLLKIF